MIIFFFISRSGQDEIIKMIILSFSRSGQDEGAEMDQLQAAGLPAMNLVSFLSVVISAVVVLSVFLLLLQFHP